MNLRYFLTSLFSSFIFMSGCFNNNEEYTEKKAYVTSSSYIHIGNGYSKLKVYVAYEFNGINYKNSVKADGTYIISANKIISAGDTILIEINKKKPQEIKYVKKVYPKNDDKSFKSKIFEAE